MSQRTLNFTLDELRCRCEVCNREMPHALNDKALFRLQRFRVLYGIPFVPNSVFRCALHEDERDKDKPGTHHHGAMDVPVAGSHLMYRAIKSAIEAGCTTIIIYSWGIHIDWRKRDQRKIWVAE